MQRPDVWTTEGADGGFAIGMRFAGDMLPATLG